MTIRREEFAPISGLIDRADDLHSGRRHTENAHTKLSEACDTQNLARD